MGVLHCINVKAIRLITRGTATIASQLMNITLFVGIIFRLMHTGQVCSGDFLEDNKSTSGYLVS